MPLILVIIIMYLVLSVMMISPDRAPLSCLIIAEVIMQQNAIM